MTYAGWHIDLLSFEGKDKAIVGLAFGPGLTLVYGASNTGKSFALKALDFMLGGSELLPNIDERRPYDLLAMEMTLSENRRVRLARGLAGGAFKLSEEGREKLTLAPRHDADSTNNLSNFLLHEMGSGGKKIAIDAAGTHSNLSFRDIARVVLTDELSIQSETSPVESGDRGASTRERSVLKYLLTGQDDSAITPIIKPKDFRTSRAAQVNILQGLIDEIHTELSDYPDPEGLQQQSENLDHLLERIEGEMVDARASVRTLLDGKRRLTSEIAIAERRTVDIGLSLESFGQLQDVYSSDIARLESIEEAGFLLGSDGKRACPVCGAPAESQEHSHSRVDIESVRVAAEREIQKIRQQRDELVRTMIDTEGEALRIADLVKSLRAELNEVESQLEKATPNFDAQQRRLAEVVPLRDRVRYGLGLIERRAALEKQKMEIEGSRPPKRDSSVQIGLTTQVALEFADVVHDVLLSWGFPGQKRVSFDLSTYDLIIDGKERRNNGKGVRAITHAAFKVALLLYCRERKLPHPGFLVLDTPLLTYRDPFKKADDELTADEEELRNTDLKERFFEHLGHLGTHAQFTIFENVDPPAKIEEYAKVETFTNDPNNGRQGLL